ncbi:MAG: hypothetical protein AAB601_00815 [Patescibacteria group bacterium]
MTKTTRVVLGTGAVVLSTAVIGGVIAVPKLRRRRNKDEEHLEGSDPLVDDMTQSSERPTFGDDPERRG